MKSIRLGSLGILAIVATLCGLILTAPTYAQSRQLRKLVGDWDLSAKATPSDKRLVTFVISDGQVTGTYTTEAGERLPITDISFANGRYSFRVSNAELVFRDFRSVGNHLEGVKLLTAQVKGRSVPQVVQMVRKSSR